MAVRFPGMTPPIGGGGDFSAMTDDQLGRLERSSSVMGQAIARAVRTARARARANSGPGPAPVVDLAGRYAAARAAGDRTRRRAAGSNLSTRPRTPAPLPVMDLAPRPGAWRLY